MTNSIKHCADCRNGEHDNYDNNVRMVIVRDPDNNNRIVKRSYMCETHVEDYLNNDYTVTNCR